MTNSIMKDIAGKIQTALLVIAISITTACVSSPDEKQPEAIEAANNALSTGVNHYNDSKLELAIAYFNNALRDFRSIDHQYGIASSCLNLSKSHLSTGNIDTADAYLIQAKKIIERENIKQLDDHVRIIESSIAIEHNQFAQAKATLQPLLQNDHNNAFTLAAIQNRTRIAFAETTPDSDEAKQWTEKFEQEVKSNGQKPSNTARLNRFKAALSNDAREQESQFSAALDIYRQQTNRPGIAATLQEWGDALIKQKQNEAALDKLERALYIRQSLQDRKNSLDILNSLMQISNDSKKIAWIEKLQDKEFKQWDEFVAAFNRFPN